VSLHTAVGWGRRLGLPHFHIHTHGLHPIRHTHTRATRRARPKTHSRRPPSPPSPPLLRRLSYSSSAFSRRFSRVVASSLHLLCKATALPVARLFRPDKRLLKQNVSGSPCAQAMLKRLYPSVREQTNAAVMLLYQVLHYQEAAGAADAVRRGSRQKRVLQVHQKLTEKLTVCAST
jgi:hypothetical protein